MHPPSHQDYHETPAASRQRIRHLSQGFTLIELLVVIAVAVIMATWALPNFQHMIARHEVASEAIRIRTALARMLHRAGQTLPDLRLGEDIGATGLRLAIS
nr:prepilin-type N-terminal cleavage/methylation domain-containing protein [Halomonas socia]